MGKKAHGRLVHELREALYRAGFMPTRITQLETPKGLCAIRSPGFKVEKHNDGKSVRLFHIMGRVPAEMMDRHARMSLEREQMRHVLDYKTKLEQEGFSSIGVYNQDRFAPYSLWRRAAEALPAGNPRSLDCVAPMMQSEEAEAVNPFNPRSLARVAGAR